MTDVQSRAALVTGGAKRVGRAVALRLAEAGMDVAITYATSETEAHEVVAAIESLGRKAIAIHADFNSDNAVEHVFEQYINACMS